MRKCISSIGRPGWTDDVFDADDVTTAHNFCDFHSYGYHAMKQNVLYSSEVWKLFSHISASYAAFLPCAVLPWQARRICQNSLQNLLYNSFCLSVAPSSLSCLTEKAAAVVLSRCALALFCVNGPYYAITMGGHYVVTVTAVQDWAKIPL